MSLSFALLIVFMFVAFGLTTLCRRWIDIPTLLGVAIGCAVNANIFNPVQYGIKVGELVFSFEIVLYTLFMYTVVIRVLDYGYKDAKRMTLTTVAAIIISAVIELFAMLAANNGFDKKTFQDFSYYIFSSIGTTIGVWVMVLITIELRKVKVSDYLILPIGIIISSIIHAIFYYGGMSLVQMRLDVYTLYLALGAIIGKAVCIVLAEICYLINKKFWVPLNLLNYKEEKEESNEK